jgi:hypothetical protein
LVFCGDQSKTHSNTFAFLLVLDLFFFITSLSPSQGFPVSVFQKFLRLLCSKFHVATMIAEAYDGRMTVKLNLDVKILDFRKREKAFSSLLLKAGQSRSGADTDRTQAGFLRMVKLIRSIRATVAIMSHRMVVTPNFL